MSAQRFLFWLKGYLNACEVEGVTYSRDHINRILTVLELAIVADIDQKPLKSASTALEAIEKLY